MNRFRADLHIHSVLSPCGDLWMSPANIVKESVARGLDIIAITDHNHTGHCKLTRSLGEEANLWVVYGAEVTTQEDVHCLTFFDTDEQLRALQLLIDEHMPKVTNDIGLFGHQVIVDDQEQILETIEHSLYPGIHMSIEELQIRVQQLGGLFVPAHVDRMINGLYGQLGFFPESLEPDAVELFRNSDPEALQDRYPELEQFSILRNSDAHFLEDIGRQCVTLNMASRDFNELRRALHKIEGRFVEQCEKIDRAASVTNRQKRDD